MIGVRTIACMASADIHRQLGTSVADEVAEDPWPSEKRR
jgi:hypothetical protein